MDKSKTKTFWLPNVEWDRDNTEIIMLLVLRMRWERVWDLNQRPGPRHFFKLKSRRVRDLELLIIQIRDKTDSLSGLSLEMENSTLFYQQVLMNDKKRSLRERKLLRRWVNNQINNFKEKEFKINILLYSYNINILKTCFLKIPPSPSKLDNQTKTHIC